MLAQCTLDKVSIIPQSQANRSAKIMLSKFEYPLSWVNVTSRHYKKHVVCDSKKQCLNGQKLPLLAKWGDWGTALGAKCCDLGF